MDGISQYLRLPSALTLLTMAVSAVWLIALGVDKSNNGIAATGIVLALLGFPLLRLGAREEASPSRLVGVWISVLAYMGVVAGFLLAMTGSSNATVEGQPPTGFPGLLFGTGNVLLFVFIPLGLIALGYTLFTYTHVDHAEPADNPEGRATARRGLELGAATGAAILVLFGLLLVLIGDHPAWVDGGRAAAALAVVLLTTALVVLGAYRHAPSSPERLGLTMLWVGVVGLTLFGVLDSISATGLSGQPAGYGTDLPGIGYWFLPGAALGLFAAMAGTTHSAHRRDGQPGSLTSTAHRL